MVLCKEVKDNEIRLPEGLSVETLTSVKYRMRTVRKGCQCLGVRSYPRVQVINTGSTARDECEHQGS